MNIPKFKLFPARMVFKTPERPLDYSELVVAAPVREKLVFDGSDEVDMEDPETQKLVFNRAINFLYSFRWGGAKLDETTKELVSQGLSLYDHKLNLALNEAIGAHRVAVVGDSEGARKTTAVVLKNVLDRMREIYKEKPYPSKAMPNSPFISRGRNQLRYAAKEKILKLPKEKQEPLMKLYWLSMYAETGRLFERKKDGSTVLNEMEKKKLPDDLTLDDLSKKNNLESKYFEYHGHDEILDEEITSIKIAKLLLDEVNKVLDKPIPDVSTILGKPKKETPAPELPQSYGPPPPTKPDESEGYGPAPEMPDEPVDIYEDE